jgi:glycosyltransferase involved in cell wall biosynthesis
VSSKLKIINLLRNSLELLIIRNSGLFDRDYYLRVYPDVQSSNQNPIMHYIKTGWREGKNPSEDFNTHFYLRENKDVRHSEMNPLVHYIKYGRVENRPPNSSLSKGSRTYTAWIDQYDTLTPTDISLIKAHIETFEHRPLISILMPVFNPNELFLCEALDSLISQCYQNWECCIADDASTNPKIREILESYTNKDPRFKLIFRESNGHISAASNSALSLATGDYIGLFDHDDVLREHALYMIVNEINRYPKLGIIYTDEDLIDEYSVRYDPYFKPDWNPDLFCGHNLVTHFVVLRTDLIKDVGGFREGYEGAQDWDLVMQISEIVQPDQIRHIPYILYHWRAASGSTALSIENKAYAKAAQRSTLRSHFTRINQQVEITHSADGFWKIKYLIAEPKPLVSIIIPTRNQLQLLQKCLVSIRNKTKYLNYEILIIDNLSDDPEILRYFSEIVKDEKISLQKYPHAFNYSAINNHAVNFAKGEVLIFLNNDIEVISPDWLDEMVGHSVRPNIGAVGVMLYYPNDTIQHAGVVLGMKGIAGHIYYGSPRGMIGQRGRARLTQNFSAVTAACMAVEKSKFIEVNGFNEKSLPIAYNDIDLCLRLIKAGYRNIWTPHAELYHHESASRASEDTPEKITRVKSEAAYLVSQWAEITANDPVYNPNLSLTLPDFSLAFPPRVVPPWFNRN